MKNKTTLDMSRFCKNYAKFKNVFENDVLDKCGSVNTDDSVVILAYELFINSSKTYYKKKGENK